MRKTTVVLVALALAGFAGTALAGDTLQEVRKRGVLVAGVKSSTPPFGFLKAGTRATIVGYDVDMARGVADRLGVRLQLKAVTSASRIPLLKKGEIDLIAATMTETPDRAREIDFSATYFVTGQKFLAPKGTVRSLADLAGKKVGTVKGSTSEKNLRMAVPTAGLLTFSDYPAAFLALEEGVLAAVTTDETILAALLAKSAKRDRFEIPDLQISGEPYGMGVRKGDPEFLAAVDQALVEMESSGEAKRIFDKWFGPASEVPMARTFTIVGRAR